ncbi:hypothetical protein CPS_2435 [Colwellia psychrerythraea 34H]|uniref:Uncharacterized protein n=1 Tax=Colwellia psychrerythraea (strain 34H / ATCC BAA-681) TaxID=167879 RepID=Q481W7_COLP3|nr:hypothetical protein CPS_2435 [Colwellia psychrerythraea 34H]
MSYFSASVAAAVAAVAFLIAALISLISQPSSSNNTSAIELRNSVLSFSVFLFCICEIDSLFITVLSNFFKPSSSSISNGARGLGVTSLYAL